MKKIIFKTAAAALLVSGLAFNFSLNNTNNNNALASLEFIANISVAQTENPECPNGCLENGPGCYCYGWYSYLLEAKW